MKARIDYSAYELILGRLMVAIRKYAKRVYDPIGKDGVRILVDRLWPRGVSKDNLQGVWIKEAAPSTELRKWYDHQPEKWLEYKRRYFAELDERPEFVKKIVMLVYRSTVFRTRFIVNHAASVMASFWMARTAAGVL